MSLKVGEMRYERYFHGDCGPEPEMGLTTQDLTALIFGAIFGSLFLMTCIISVVKAYRDRQKIKERIIAKRSGKNGVARHHGTKLGRFRLDTVKKELMVPPVENTCRRSSFGTDVIVRAYDNDMAVSSEHTPDDIPTPLRAVVYNVSPTRQPPRMIARIEQESSTDNRQFIKEGWSAQCGQEERRQYNFIPNQRNSSRDCSVRYEPYKNHQRRGSYEAAMSEPYLVYYPANAQYCEYTSSPEHSDYSKSGTKMKVYRNNACKQNGTENMAFESVEETYNI